MDLFSQSSKKGLFYGICFCDWFLSEKIRWKKTFAECNFAILGEWIFAICEPSKHYCLKAPQSWTQYCREIDEIKWNKFFMEYLTADLLMMKWLGRCHICKFAKINPLSANPQKWLSSLKQQRRQQLTNCLCVFV